MRLKGFSMRNTPNTEPLVHSERENLRDLLARLGVRPTDAEGVWVSRFADGAGAQVHACEIDALRAAVGGAHMEVVFVPWGEVASRYQPEAGGQNG